MSDGRYGSIAAAASDRPLTSKAINILSPSWLDIIEGMGWEAHRVPSLTAFESAIARWSRRAPLFLEAMFDPRQYVQLTRELR
jgi:hypothetical protein